LIFAARADQFYFVHYEVGGIAHEYVIALFEASDTKAKPQWAHGGGRFASIDDFSKEISRTQFQNEVKDYCLVIALSTCLMDRALIHGPTKTGLVVDSFDKTPCGASGAERLDFDEAVSDTRLDGAEELHHRRQCWKPDPVFWEISTLSRKPFSIECLCPRASSRVSQSLGTTVSADTNRFWSMPLCLKDGMLPILLPRYKAVGIDLT